VAEFDAAAFAVHVGAGVREAVEPFAKKAGDALALRIVDEVRIFEHDIEATLRALKAEADPERAARLERDLTRFLPARRDAIISEVVSTLSTDAQAAAETALNVAVKIVIAAARAFVPIP